MQPIYFSPRHHLTKQSPAKLIAGFCFIYYYWGYLISPLIFHHNTISRIQYQKQQTIEDKT